MVSKKELVTTIKAECIIELDTKKLNAKSIEELEIILAEIKENNKLSPKQDDQKGQA